MTLSRNAFFSCPKVLLLVVVVISLLPSRLYSSDNSDSKVEHLYNVATARLAGVPVTRDADAALRRFIESGVRAHPEASKEKSEKAIKTFVDAMLKDARSREDILASHKVEEKVDMISFNNAKTSVCPLYPFC